MIYILGGNGFVGSAFSRYLKVTGREYRVIDRARYDELSGTECDVLINANGNSKKFLAKDDPKGEFQASVTTVRNSLVDFKFRKYVFLSTSDIYPDCSVTESTTEDTPIDIAAQSPYGFHKYLAEQCVRHAAKNWLIVRQGGFVGEGMKKNAVYDVLHGEKLWVHPESRFQFINTDDSARVIMSLVDADVQGEIFNLTAMDTISVREIMDLAGRAIPHDPNAKAVRYEISTTKVASRVQLPNTFDTVGAFLASGMRG